MLDGVLFANDGRQAHDHARQSRLDVLIRIVDEIFDERQYVIHDDGFARLGWQIVAKVFDLARRCGTHLGLVVAQQTTERSDQLVLCDLGSNRLLQLDQFVYYLFNNREN